MMTDMVLIAVPDGNEGDIASVFSQYYHLGDESSACVSFIYIMMNRGSGILKLSIDEEDKQLKPLWSVADKEMPQV